MNSVTQLQQNLERQDKIVCLLQKAYDKQDAISSMPYYKVFDREGERKRDLIKNHRVILRLQMWFYESSERTLNQWIF